MSACEFLSSSKFQDRNIPQRVSLCVITHVSYVGVLFIDSTLSSVNPVPQYMPQYMTLYNNTCGHYVCVYIVYCV